MKKKYNIKRANEHKAIELQKEIEHIIVDIKYIPKKALKGRLKDNVLVKSLQELSDAAGNAIKRMKEKK